EVDARLRGDGATKAAILEALADPNYDVVHFNGHGYFDSLDGTGSGLICAGEERLSLADLKGIEIGPRLVFFNACESARMRGKPTQSAARALAEYILCGGVEAYLGTYWPVEDVAAAHFAVAVYRELARGKQLDQAVLNARKLLHEAKRRDWANYVLYGSGAFKIKTG
ncbi:MAG TPA: CHAT domain-containing protein, partial [Polyangiaceae bacterium]|nr:CHAT domain-containing protein [Polyangiaceae bacterium]